jgi:hypothetical protein
LSTSHLQTQLRSVLSSVLYYKLLFYRALPFATHLTFRFSYYGVGLNTIGGIYLSKFSYLSSITADDTG